MNNNIILEQEFELVRGFFRSFNKGNLYLTEDKIEFKGKNIINIEIDKVTSANIGSWNGNQILEIKTIDSSFKFYPYKQISNIAAMVSPEFSALQNKSGSVLGIWIDRINKVRNVKKNKINNDSEAAIDILKIRLAKGEISIEEFSKLKELL